MPVNHERLTAAERSCLQIIATLLQMRNRQDEGDCYNAALLSGSSWTATRMDVMILASLLGAGLLVLDLWTAPRAEGKSPSKRSA